MDGLHFKGVPLGADLEQEAIRSGRLDVAAGDLSTPVACLRSHAVAANAEAMSAWCRRHGVALAPHAKTTMAAGLLEVQRRLGVWAMTAALPRQVAALWEMGFGQVLLANEVADQHALSWLAEHVGEGDRSLHVYADSTEGVCLLDEAVAEAGGPGFAVLVERGHEQGRTGCRTSEEALEVARAIAAAPGLRLAGVAGYEGTIGSTREAEVVAKVDDFLDGLADLARQLVQEGLVTSPVVTAGGSLFFDRVAERVLPRLADLDATVVLRSGCYLVHDHGLYAHGTPSAAGVVDAPVLAAALSVWARVVSAPEPGLALLDAGRRDLSHDAGLPVPLRRARAGVRAELTGGRVEALSDQHAFVRGDLDLRVGDLVELGISHPCTTLDRHRAVFLVDDEDHVIGVVETFF